MDNSLQVSFKSVPTAFLSDESGAVTVDWTVITAAIVGLGIASFAVVQSGVGDLSGDIARNLGRPFIQTAFLVADDFSNGPGNWIGAGTNFISGFGDVLGPLRGDAEGREQVYQIFEIPGGALEFNAGFDLLSIDSLDGGLIDHGWGAEEGPVMYLNGQEVARARSQGGRLTWTYADVPGVTIRSEVVSSQTNIGANGWDDGINTVRITFEEPQDTVQVGFGLKANQPIHDETMGIDNFTFQAM